VLAATHPQDVASGRELEHANWQVILPTERHRGGIHHPNPVDQEPIVAQLREHLSTLVAVGVSVVDALDLGRLEQGLGLNLHRPQRCRGIRREVRVPRASRENHHRAFFQMPYRPSPNVRLGHLTNLDGAHHSDGDPSLLEGVLERQGVDDRGEHAHVVALRAVHACASTLEAAKDVPTPNDDADLHSAALNLAELLGDLLERLHLNAEAALFATQRLTAQLENDAAIAKTRLDGRWRRENRIELGRHAGPVPPARAAGNACRKRARSGSVSRFAPSHRAFVIVLATTILTGCSGCDDDALAPKADAGPEVAGLTPQQAARVIAEVGDHKITLGDFAETLSRMDQFDRLRYQTKERRRELLQEMIDVELLAVEAKRRGLDKDPEVQEAIRLLMRDALLAKAREGMPPPSDLRADEVKDYYDANLEKYTEPERRRVEAIIVGRATDAQDVLEAVRKATDPADWGKLHAQHDMRPKSSKASPADLAGSLGFVGPHDDPKGGNVSVPNEVRDAVFELGKMGDVHAKVLAARGKFYVIRLGSISKGHTRSLSEADRSIRVAITQKRLREREQALEDELRAKFKVEIDEEALAEVPIPESLKRFEGPDQPPAPEKPPGKP